MHPREDFHYARGKDVRAEKTEVVAGADAGNEEPLFGLCGGGLFGDGFDAVHAIAAGKAAPADGSIEGKKALAGGLNGRNGAGLGLGEADEAGGAAVAVAFDIEVVADEV